MAFEVIESQLAKKLSDILSPISVYEMSSSQVERIAGEPEEIRTEREELEKQLSELCDCQETLKPFAGLRVSGGK